MNNKSPFTHFLTLAAICSILGAITTALLIFLPNPEAADFETRALLHQNTLYLSKLWILFIHPQVNFIACLGLAVLLFKKYPSRIILGTFFMFVWSFSEMSQQGILIDALNQIWRPGYLGADDASIKYMFKTLIHVADGLSDSKYFLVIYGFGLGSLLFGAAFLQENGLGKWIGISLLFIGILSLASFARYYLGQHYLNHTVNWVYHWVYPYLQPLVRIAIGIWIWQKVNLDQLKSESLVFKGV